MKGSQIPRRLAAFAVRAWSAFRRDLRMPEPVYAPQGYSGDPRGDSLAAAIYKLSWRTYPSGSEILQFKSRTHRVTIVKTARRATAAAVIVVVALALAEVVPHFIDDSTDRIVNRVLFALVTVLVAITFFNMLFSPEWRVAKKPLKFRREIRMRPGLKYESVQALVDDFKRVTNAEDVTVEVKVLRRRWGRALAATVKVTVPDTDGAIVGYYPDYPPRIRAVADPLQGA